VISGTAPSCPSVIQEGLVGEMMNEVKKILFEEWGGVTAP